MALDSIERHHIFEDYDELSERLYKIYLDSFKNSLVKIVGSSTMFGNPTKLIGTLGTGLTEAY